MIEPRLLFNFIQGSDITGESSFDVWKALNPDGTEAEFLEYLRSGPAGDTTPIYYLSTSNTVIKKDANNVLTPAEVVFSGYYRKGNDVTRYEYAGRFIIEETVDGIDWITVYTSELDEVTKSFIPSPDTSSVRCTLYASGGTEKVIDTQNIVILSDIDDIEVGARNILMGTNVRYEVSNSTSESFVKKFSVVDGFDLQRFIGKHIALSCYADTIGDHSSIIVDEKLDIAVNITWSDSTGVNSDKTLTLDELSLLGISKNRTSVVYEVIAPDNYDIIADFSVVLTCNSKPTSDNIWIVERPKLEIGNISTQWILAQEEVETLSAILSNEAHDISTDCNGANGDYSVCATKIQVFSGSTDVTLDSEFSSIASAGVTHSLDLETKICTVSNMTTDTGYVDIIATYKNLSVTKRFSLSKTKAGNDGKSAYESWSEIEGNENKSEDEFKSVLNGTSSRDFIILRDTVNGFDYVVKMVEGNLVSSIITDSIEITTLPSKTVYDEGEALDTTGMIVVAKGADGSEHVITDYTAEIVNSKDIVVTYKEGDKTFTYTATDAVRIASVEDTLIDFTYNKNGDGTYTLTGWKETLNGEPSTEMVIPDSDKIIL